MSLIYKAAQVVAIVRNDPKPWTMDGRSGVSHSAKMAVIGTGAGVAEITVKAKTAEDLDKKLSKCVIGKPADILIEQVVPVFKAGDRKAASYELTA